MVKYPHDQKENRLSLGFSPCPNDTFMFDAMVHNKVDTNGLAFDVHIEDIESLNRLVLDGQLDICKVSFAAYLHAAEHYQLLNAGSALGNGVGPLLVTRPDRPGARSSHSSNFIVAIPGRYTTANYLFALFFPEVKDKREMVFSSIEEAVLSGAVDAGVIIHESRFTYQAKGLVKVADLGELWQKETGQLLPLGGIAIRRNLPDDIKQSVNSVLQSSVKYAMASPSSSMAFVEKHAREMDQEVMLQHINLYVNSYSVDLGPAGREAISLFIRKAAERQGFAHRPHDLFACPAGMAEEDMLPS